MALTNKQIKKFLEYWEKKTDGHLKRYGVILKKDSHFILKKWLKKVI